MRDNGYYGIGVECMKSILNYGTLFRSAQIFDADFIFIIGRRFKIQSSDKRECTKDEFCIHTFYTSCICIYENGC